MTFVPQFPVFPIIIIISKFMEVTLLHKIIFWLESWTKHSVVWGTRTTSTFAHWTRQDKYSDSMPHCRPSLADYQHISGVFLFAPWWISSFIWNTRLRSILQNLQTLSQIWRVCLSSTSSHPPPTADLPGKVIISSAPNPPHLLPLLTRLSLTPDPTPPRVWRCSSKGFYRQS